MSAGDRLVTSTDGVGIASRISGSGPPLVLVHGTSADRHTFRFIGPILEQHFTIVAVDRRGRGGSGDSTNAYRIEQEFDDIAAVVDSLDGPANLFGHSFGATVALGAARIARNLRRLILYEATPGIPVASPALLAKLDAMLAGNDREGLLTTVMTEFAGLGPEELAQFKASPLWKPRVQAAHTIPREVRAEQDYSPDPVAFAAVATPTLFLLGSESASWSTRGADAVRALIPDNETRVLVGGTRGDDDGAWSTGRRDPQLPDALTAIARFSKKGSRLPSYARACTKEPR